MKTALLALLLLVVVVAIEARLEINYQVTLRNSCFSMLYLTKKILIF